MTWSEARLQVASYTEGYPDDALLLDVVAPLVDALRSRIGCWHYLWEPDLWLRVRWRSPEDVELGCATIRSTLDAAQREGRFQSWRFDVYDHDADLALMGPEMAEIFDADLQRGAERALALLALERSGGLAKDRDFHWARLVHTTTNQLHATWADEYRLCLAQARYRAFLLRCGKHTQHDELARIVDRLDALLAEVDAIERAERAQLSAWRDAERPEISDMFELPGTFSRKPGDNRS